MFITTIIPTVNRPVLSRAVDSVLQQDFPKDQFEVIVVNDSGQPLAKTDWQKSSQVKVIDTNRRERCFARNAGAAAAKGKYLHFLDDDDWMMPGAFKAIWDLSHKSHAAWLYGGFRFEEDSSSFFRDVFLNKTGNCFIQLLSGEWLPLQVAFILAEAFFSVGGFTDRPSLISFEDQHLSRMVNFRFDIAYTPEILTSIQRNLEISTTDYRKHDVQWRESREYLLDLPGAFSRLRLSADTARQEISYWHGRIVYLYLASGFHNLIREHRFFTACSRILYALSALLLTGKCLLTVDFWRGIHKYYVSPSFK